MIAKHPTRTYETAQKSESKMKKTNDSISCFSNFLVYSPAKRQLIMGKENSPMTGIDTYARTPIKRIGKGVTIMTKIDNINFKMKGLFFIIGMS